MKVLLAQFEQETSHFNPHATPMDRFDILRGDELVESLAGTHTYVAGGLDIFAEEGIEVIPTYGASSVTSGGPVVSGDLDEMTEQLLAAVEAVADEVDGAYIAFHGAMAGIHEPDPEGRILERVRQLLGDRPIVCSFDLHGILADRLVENADILYALHTYPHVDQRQTGQRAARGLVKLLGGGVKPVVARVKLPLLVRGDELITATGLFGQAIDRCKQFEATEKGLSAIVNIGNPFTDVPELRTNVIVTSDGDAEAARQLADELATFMWTHRERLQAPLTSIDEAIRLAGETDGLTVFSDAADATSSGASGDSNWILKGLLAAEFSKRALVPLVDAPAAAEAFRRGVGSRFTVALGGTVDLERHEPVEAEVYVQSLHDGVFTEESGETARAGQTAVLVNGQCTIMVTEHPVSIMGRRVFESRGLQPVDFDIVVCKSPNGFRTHYEAICQRIIAVDAPGSTSANLRSLPYTNVARPIYPLDETIVPELVVEMKA
ncbi:MAG: M81 family metallopeptidase [Gemmatimonadetes bacterium]|nr:M81 family metallopeptidase [Gemmatimonadota bacterium]MBT6147832.1 M81 family metallopeptidase [Gemmatimonadota bacterium]MBT7863196.1 M81 family metallopeptidase [Gemmatimonadota bacterium]